MKKASDLLTVLDDERFRDIGPYVRDMMERFAPIRAYVEARSTLFRRKIQDCGSDQGSVLNTLHEMAVVFACVLNDSLNVEYEPERSGPDVRISLKDNPDSATWVEITTVGEGRPVLDLKDFVEWITENLKDLEGKCVSNLDFGLSVQAGLEPITIDELREVFRRKSETLAIVRDQVLLARERKGEVFRSAVPGVNLSKFDLDQDSEDGDRSLRLAITTRYLGTMVDSKPYLDLGGCRPELPRARPFEKIRDVCMAKDRQFPEAQRGVLIIRTMSEELDCPLVFRQALRELDENSRFDQDTCTGWFDRQSYRPSAILLQHSWPSQSRPGNFVALNRASPHILPRGVLAFIKSLPLWPGKNRL